MHRIQKNLVGPGWVMTDLVERQIEARAAARAGRDFAEADRIRDLLSERGIALEDGPEGTRWKVMG